MKYNKQGIRTIHDAIDAKVGRVTLNIKTKKSKRENLIIKEVHDNIGLTPLIDQITILTGRSPKDSFHYYESDSPLGIALKEARKELNTYDNIIATIEELAENTHIKVVTGEFSDAINTLDDEINKLIKNIL